MGRATSEVKKKETLNLGQGGDFSRVSNRVVTARYNVFSFLPVSFLNQFRHFSNCYFLVIFILALIGDKNVSSLNFYESPYDYSGPLINVVIVVLIGMAFDLVYDIFRHQEDAKVNKSKTTRLHHTTLEPEECTWDALFPGDFVLVKQGEVFPADVLLLLAKVEDDSEVEQQQHCYVETSNIDGETNLKLRYKPPSLPSDLSDLLNWTVFYDLPQPVLDFSGYVLPVGKDKDEAIELSFQHLLLRGSRLKNTPSIVGVVLYAGRETKSVLSSSQTRSKVSNVMVLVNRAILFILFVGLLLVLISATLSTIVYSQSSVWYLASTDSPYVFGPFWSSFFTYILLYSNLLPISLIVATTLTNFAQAIFISWDMQMYSADSDKFVQCKTLELAQEIGQVSFVFSDKTGTLTRNEMKLVRCFVHNEPLLISDVSVDSSLPTPRLFAHLLEKHDSSPDIQDFFLALSLCHTVIVDRCGNFNAEGPDEEALVLAMSELGYKLVHTTKRTYIVEVHRVRLAFEILAINAFDSYRKRMSVLVRYPEGGRIEIIVKGADSVMEDLLIGGEDYTELAVSLKSFADQGLRTLVLAKRVVSVLEWTAYQAEVQRALVLMGPDKQEAMMQAASLVENRLSLLGVTGIEDRLQDGVPETLRLLRLAGIKTWVLTGDKVETAVNIGFSCGLLTTSMKVLSLVGKNHDDNAHFLQSLDDALLAADKPTSNNPALKLLYSPFRSSQPKRVYFDSDDFYTAENPYQFRPMGFSKFLKSTTPKTTREEERVKELALVLDGDALEGILSSSWQLNDKKKEMSTVQHQFLRVANQCTAVLACRVSPKQKALLVRLVRNGVRVGNNKEPVTLAIGDGSNDVGMIQESRVGVVSFFFSHHMHITHNKTQGISGREGCQAVNSADFSIGQFRFLARLLLVHGRWNYRRMAFLVLFIFYSHTLPVLVSFAYNIVNLWSGTTPFPYIFLIAYSYIVVIPAGVIAAFNRDISPETAFLHPESYISGRANLHMGRYKVLESIFKSVIHAIILCTLMFGVFSGPQQTVTYLDLGTTLYWCVVVIVLVRLAFECYSWTVPSVVVFVLCFAIFPVLEIMMYASLNSPEVLFGVQAPWVWLCTVMVSFCCFLLDVLFAQWRQAYYPNIVDHVLDKDRQQQAGRDFSFLAHIVGGRAHFLPPLRSAFAQDIVDDGEKPPSLPKRVFSFPTRLVASKKTTSQ